MFPFFPAPLSLKQVGAQGGKKKNRRLQKKGEKGPSFLSLKKGKYTGKKEEESFNCKKFSLLGNCATGKKKKKKGTRH